MIYSTVTTTLLTLCAGIAASVNIPFAQPNAHFEPPRDSLNQQAAWARVSIDFATARHEIIGRARIEGSLVVSVFVPIDIGIARSIEVSEAIRDGIVAGNIDPVVLREIRIESVQSSAAAGWFQHNIRAFFFADEV